jgi:D-alanine-D-alanine ligase
VADGLRAAGHHVLEVDIQPDDLSGLDKPCDVVFPVLHGEWGEDGALQEILEARQVPFVGSGSHASRLGMNKLDTKQAWEDAGLPTPPYVLAVKQHPDSVRSLNRIGAPAVAKAIASGSSIGVYVCRTEAELHQACQTLLNEQGRVLVEKFIEGTELTVGILEGKALSPIKIVPKSSKFFDYEAKYNSPDTEHRFNTGLPAGLIEQIQRHVEKANEVIGARDLARIDVMVDQDNNPYLIEINTMPGFTPKSLLPEMAAHDGVPFAQLVDRLVKRAYERGGLPVE